MDEEQTRALWAQGEEAWNLWALDMLKRKEELEAAASWLADWFGEGQNPETRDWLAEARAEFAGAVFVADCSFANFVFPGPANFEGAHFRGRALFSGTRFANFAHFQNARFDGEAVFKQAEFHQLGVFDDAVFSTAADFEKAGFLRNSTGPLVPAARFQKTQFKSRAEFRGSKFAGHAEFVRTQFCGSARFDEADFAGEANFEGAAFDGTAGLVKARFHSAAKFDQIGFKADARFGEAQFKGPAGFEATVFSGKSSFRMAAFADEARFDGAAFADDTRFTEAQFASPAHFRKASFSGGADLQKALFAATADFAASRFAGSAEFGGATFKGAADFSDAKFKGNASFAEAVFAGGATFFQALFKGRATFRSAHFESGAALEALQSRSTFVLAGARFAEVPSFRDASFWQPPALDHIAIADPMRIFPKRTASGEKDPRPWLLRGMKACGGSDIEARYRRLRQFAAETKDTDREREFFAQELRARRFFVDRPFGKGLGRFWFGWLYGGLSNFGRSYSRPLLAWLLSLPLFALAYIAARARPEWAAAPVPGDDAPPPVLPAWPHQADVQTVLTWLRATSAWFWQHIERLFSTGGCVSGDSSATAEAFFLSLKNSFFFLGWESEGAARRVYACLYGLEGTPGGQMLHVPLAVSATAMVQNMVSAFLLFLMLVALRNLLKTR